MALQVNLFKFMPWISFMSTTDASTFHAAPTEEIDHSLWGEMDSESEEESSEEEEDEDEEEGGDEATGLQTPVVEAGLATPSGTASSVQGLETPESLELRKRRIEADMEGGETPSLPYQIIPEKQGGRIGAAMMGSTHTYDIKRATGTKSRADTQVEMALNPEEIENMDSETMAIRAEAALREQQSQLAKEDLSDMVISLHRNFVSFVKFRRWPSTLPSRRTNASVKSRKKILSKRNTKSSSSNLKWTFSSTNSGSQSGIFFSPVSINIEVLCLAEICKLCCHQGFKPSGPCWPSGSTQLSFSHLSDLFLTSAWIWCKMPNWYYEKSNLKKTPSYLTGLDFDTETRYRREGAR